MIDKDDAKTRPGLPPARSSRCYITQRDITIPAGTILRRAADQRGGEGYVEALVGHGPNFTSAFVVQLHVDAVASGDFREVVA